MRPLAPLFASLLLGACGQAEPAPRVELEVVVDAAGPAPVETDLGYRVELEQARVMVEALRFAVAGEAHEASLLQRFAQWIVPVARAHPGHYQGGDVTGELRGRFVLAWAPPSEQPLGLATLIAGHYHSLSFTFARATEADGLDADDPLLGHTAILRGRAERDAVTTEFTAVLDSPEGRELVGVPFDAELDEDTQGQVVMQLAPRDAQEGDSLFDALDFAALDEAAEGPLLLAADADEPALQDAYHRLLRTLQTHDHFAARLALLEPP